MDGKEETIDLKSTMMMFNWVEYAVFTSMLGLSALIGVYYGWYKGNQNTVSEYLLGGQTMSIFPVTMSMVASHVSGITLLGVPAEVYMYGTQYLAVLFTTVICTILIVYFYLPVFYKLQLTSLYEYLELRFSHGTRMLASFIFAISLLLYIPVVIYVPALAFNQVTGISVHSITPIVCLVCIFYTSFGGLKAVVWTDALQSVFTLGSVVFICVLGCMNLGGLEEVLRANWEGHRLEMFNMDPNPFARNTFWTVTVGSTFTWLSHLGVHPGAVQRFIAVPTHRAATAVMLWSAVGFTIIKTLAVFVGLLVYAKYRGCDPIATRVITKSGQLLPHYVMEVAGQFPGLNGLFISGVVSAALSTMSAGLNTVAGTIYEDFVQICLKGEKMSEAKASCTMKIIVLILGAISVVMVFVVERLGGILQMAISLTGVTSGALVGVFSLGMFFPWANTKGALAGSVASILGMAWIIGGAQLYIAEGKLKFPGKITSIDNCTANLTISHEYNITSKLQWYEGVGSPVVADKSVPLVYQVSYMYYSCLGSLICLIVGITVSLLTGSQDLTKLNPDLVIPQMRRFLPKKQKITQPPPPEEYKLINSDAAQTTPADAKRLPTGFVEH